MKWMARGVLVVIAFFLFSGMGPSPHGHGLKDPFVISKSFRDKTHDPAGVTFHTKSGYLAATSEKLLNRVVSLALSGNQESFQKFIISNPQVFPLKPGIKVFIEATSWPGKIKIRPQHVEISIWTLREAIE